MAEPLTGAALSPCAKATCLTAFWTDANDAISDGRSTSSAPASTSANFCCASALAEVSEATLDTSERISAALKRPNEVKNCASSSETPASDAGAPEASTSLPVTLKGVSFSDN